MRIVTQIVVVAVMAGAGYGAWYGYTNYVQGGGQTAAAGAPRGGGPVATVDVAPVRTGTVTERVESVGTARALESVSITARNAGNVAVINFQEGQRVRAGQALIEFEGRERRADTEQARAAREEIRQQLERARALRGTGTVAEARVDQLEQQLRQADARLTATGARLEDLRITAPFDGRVGMRQVSLGALVQPGTVITTLDDISRIRIDFNLPEVWLGRLRVGLPITGRTPAFADRAFSGRVSVIDTRVDPATRTVRVTAVLDNPDEALRPGMFLNVEMGLIERPNALLVAEEALVSEGQRHYLLVVANNRVERREVRLGIRQPGQIEIVQGVQEGESVIVRGTQRVRPGQTVNPRPFRPAPTT